jgi:hypothetical protein
VLRQISLELDIFFDSVLANIRQQEQCQEGREDAEARRDEERILPSTGRIGGVALNNWEDVAVTWSLTERGSLEANGSEGKDLRADKCPNLAPRRGNTVVLATDGRSGGFASH